MVRRPTGTMISTETSSFLVEGSGLTKTYRGSRRPAIVEVNVRMQPGEILGVTGPNGAGKTTLMACLLGLLKPETGWARLGGHPSGSVQANSLVG
jgi:ABC-type multidrug transport system ATPase subunit